MKFITCTLSHFYHKNGYSNPPPSFLFKMATSPSKHESVINWHSQEMFNSRSSNGGFQKLDSPVLSRSNTPTKEQPYYPQQQQQQPYYIPPPVQQPQAQNPDKLSWKSFVVGPIKYPIFSYLSALGMAIAIIYEFVHFHDLTGQVIETNPFNPMIGPSFQVHFTKIKK